GVPQGRCDAAAGAGRPEHTEQHGPQQPRVVKGSRAGEGHRYVGQRFQHGRQPHVPNVPAVHAAEQPHATPSRCTHLAERYHHRLGGRQHVHGVCQEPHRPDPVPAVPWRSRIWGHARRADADCAMVSAFDGDVARRVVLHGVCNWHNHWRAHRHGAFKYTQPTVPQVGLDLLHRGPRHGWLWPGHVCTARRLSGKELAAERRGE
ncbi:hypothetical protein IWQ56_007409, partial [Coemansia nantahalensis]